MHTIAETPRYQADAARLFTHDEQAAIVDLVASDPGCGVVIPGGGSIRGFGGRGKRGGARVIYLFGGNLSAGLSFGSICQEREGRSHPC